MTANTAETREKPVLAERLDLLALRGLRLQLEVPREVLAGLAVLLELPVGVPQLPVSGGVGWTQRHGPLVGVGRAPEVTLVVVQGSQIEEHGGPLLAGAGAVALQVYVDPDSRIPMVGASGAIAGVLGAYLVLYPRATVAVVIPWFWFFGAFPVPAAFLIVFWFLLQLLSGVAALGTATGVTEGIAFWAHVGGFGTGLALVWVFRRRRPRRPSPPVSCSPASPTKRSTTAPAATATSR